MMMITAAAARVLIHSVNSFALKEERGSKKTPVSVAWLREKELKRSGSESEERMSLLLLSDEENYVRSFLASASCSSLFRPLI